jgi:formylglycine-generating enzyme required for sulfatase activity
VRVLLHGACVGTMVNMRGRGTPSVASESCIDKSRERVRVETSPLEDDLTRPAESAVGTWLTGRCPPPVEGDTRVCIEGGATVLGSRENSDYTPGSSGQLDSAPPRVFGLSPFYVDVDELTVGAFQEMISAGYTGPLPLANDGPIGEFTPTNPSRVCTWSLGAKGRADYPLTCVSWRASRAMCKYRGGDLLTEAQYEHVATIAGWGRKVRYPWGQESPTCDRAVWGRVPLGPMPAKCPLGDGPRRVAESANDLSPLGVRGLYGSVGEWVLDQAAPYDSPEWAAASVVDPRIEGNDTTRRSFRGLSWKAESFRPISRYPVKQEDGYGPLGVRCAYPTVLR